MTATLISNDSGFWFDLPTLLLLMLVLVGLWHWKTIQLALVKRFVLRAKEGKIGVAYNPDQPGRNHWSVTPDTGLNRALLREAKRHGFIKRNVYTKTIGFYIHPPDQASRFYERSTKR